MVIQCFALTLRLAPGLYILGTAYITFAQVRSHKLHLIAYVTRPKGRRASVSSDIKGYAGCWTFDGTLRTVPEEVGRLGCGKFGG